MLPEPTYLTLTLAIILALFPASATASGEAAPATASDDVPMASEVSVQEQVDLGVAQKRAEILDEAVDAVARSRDALAALDQGRTGDALEALATVIGKLELIVARDPDLALAPMDVGVTVHDLFATCRWCGRRCCSPRPRRFSKATSRRWKTPPGSPA